MWSCHSAASNFLVILASYRPILGFSTQFLLTFLLQLLALSPRHYAIVFCVLVWLNSFQFLETAIVFLFLGPLHILVFQTWALFSPPLLRSLCLSKWISVSMPSLPGSLPSLLKSGKLYLLRDPWHLYWLKQNFIFPLSRHCLFTYLQLSWGYELQKGRKTLPYS